jgi:hypothetical protein
MQVCPSQCTSQKGQNVVKNGQTGIILDSQALELVGVAQQRGVLAVKHPRAERQHRHLVK